MRVSTPPGKGGHFKSIDVDVLDKSGESQPLPAREVISRNWFSNVITGIVSQPLPAREVISRARNCWRWSANMAIVSTPPGKGGHFK